METLDIFTDQLNGLEVYLTYIHYVSEKVQLLNLQTTCGAIELSSRSTNIMQQHICHFAAKRL